MMDFQTVRYAREGDVVTITLDRPDRLNALSETMFVELGQALDLAVADGARAVVLTGEGRYFCSGADLGGGPSDDLGATLDAYYHPVVTRLAALDVPLVTALNGPCAGAGMSLGLAGDLVVMGESGYLLMAFANIGLVPDAGATWLAARSIGRCRTLELALLGERLGAAEAKAAGLVTRVVPDDDVMAEAMALAHRLSAGPTLALGMIRRQVARALECDFSTTLEIERANQSAAGRTADFAEAIDAFAHKRKPQFTGR
ncbi:2-(1,2-epoxy-1,2-dihydrophenyl)acetyl-CoA isomerase [Novosphingobium capsulatum]|uniref:2-(1,2-epoxy-1,2-dihydrophenyl)acetyl-CoA isomerase n=1 Tax=Novosphingobium capsulatum TaxID=13688 RepID=A0ABU1MPA2_9SPHN|nr:enoyl-CoA hydratase-related protein [Novosphingobium capsulatum]MDR6512082.1 2-(1,2-epoxy-1,2-dihydrophenyl)acetyl-CoA isomerase [Novosphingobium capsulatum]